jgi:hypothetical protein
MPKIEINSCEHTSNIIALKAIIGFMNDNSHANTYAHDKVIHLDNGVSCEVKEVPVDVNNPSCSCSFSVRKVQAFNRID